MSKPEKKPDNPAPTTTKEKIAEMGGKVISHVFGQPSFMPGPAGTAHLKAQFANGLDELRQVFYPGVEQVQAGPAPGLYGMPTTGEATIEKTGKMSLDELRGHAKGKEQEALQRMQGQQRDNGLER